MRERVSFGIDSGIGVWLRGGLWKVWSGLHWIPGRWWLNTLGHFRFIVSIFAHLCYGVTEVTQYSLGRDSAFRLLRCSYLFALYVMLGE